MTTKTVTVDISYEALEDVLVSHLMAIGAIHDNEFVTMFDIPVPLNENGLVSIDLDLFVDEAQTELDLETEMDEIN